MATKQKTSTTQSLSTKERNNKKFIELGFMPHKHEWSKTSKKLVDAYNGRYWHNTEQRHRFKVNTIASLANLLLPNFVFDSPYLRVRPTSAKYYKRLIDGVYKQVDNIRAANIKEATLNHKYRQIDAVGEQRKSVLDSFFYGFGITKVGYSYDTIAEDDKDYVLKDSPFLKRVKPLDFGWHPLATGVDDSVFLIHRTVTTRERLKTSNKFDKKLITQVKGQVPQYLKDRFTQPTQKDALAEFVTLYEVHNQDEDMIYTFAGEDHLLLDKVSNPYKFNGPHFSQIRFMTDNEQFEGIPLMNLIYDEAIALNEIMTLIVEHFRKFPGQMFMNKGAVDEDDLIKIQNGEQGSTHFVNDISQILLKAPLNMGGEYFNLVNLFQSIMDKTLGIPDFSRLTSNTRKSATEANFVQGDANVRRQYALKLVKDFMLDGIKKLSALQEQFQDDKESVQATGDLRGLSVEYDKGDLVYYKEPKDEADESTFRHDFDIDSLKAFNEAQVTSINNALQILSTYPVLQPGVRAMDPIKLTKMILRGLGLDLEALQADTPDGTVFVTPEIENDIARNPDKHKNQPMPSPKPGEDLDYHIQVHTDDLKTKGPNEQILEHLAETILMKQQASVPAQPQALEAPGDQGPVGPLQQPPGMLQ